VLADQARAQGDPKKAADYENTAQVFATQLVAAEQSMEDMKTLHDQALGAAGQARRAVENNAMILQQKLAERTKLLSQLEQAAHAGDHRPIAGVDELAGRAGQHPVARRRARADRAALRQRDGPRGTRRQLGRGPDARGAEVHARHGRREPPRPDPQSMAIESGQHQQQPAVGPGQAGAVQHTGNGSGDASVARLDQIRASMQKPQSPPAGNAS
jgi:hypothetical protein